MKIYYIIKPKIYNTILQLYYYDISFYQMYSPLLLIISLYHLVAINNLFANQHFLKVCSPVKYLLLSDIVLIIVNAFEISL